VPLFSAPFMTLVQETVAPEMHGRVFSYVGIVMALATPIGAVAFGPLADVFSVQALLVAAGIITVVVIAVAISLPSGRAAIRIAREKKAEADADNADGDSYAAASVTAADDPVRNRPPA
jgi:DHA3 family macrolide efflux protein-like MFS transporter